MGLDASIFDAGRSTWARARVTSHSTSAERRAAHERQVEGPGELAERRLPAAECDRIGDQPVLIDESAATANSSVGCEGFPCVYAEELTEAGFTDATRRHRRVLRACCYRMLVLCDEGENHV
jgi:hypothetical protein